MKKIILIIFFCFLPSISHAGLCLSGEHYKIVNYNGISNEKTLKGGSFLDYFLNKSFIKSNNITSKDIHYVDNTFCKYDNFDSLNKLSYSDLLLEDRKILLLNLSFSLLIIIIILIFLIFFTYKKSKGKN